MNYDVRLSERFKKEAKRLSKRYPSLKEDLAALGNELLKNPLIGTDLGSGIRKVRLAIKSKGKGKGKGKGKSGGARVITYTVVANVEEGFIYLITLYDKSESASLSIESIKDLIKESGL